MKNYIPLLLICIILPYACNTNKTITNTTPVNSKAELIAVFSKCNEAVGLFEFDGADFNLLQEITDFSRDTFRFEVSATESRFYYVGTRSGQKRPVILGTETTVLVEGDCNNARQARFKNSSINKGYDELLQQFTDWNVRSRQEGMNWQNALSDPERLQVAVAAMAQTDQEKREYIDTLKKYQPYLAKVAVLNIYLSFQNNNRGRFDNEVEYFAKAYFEQADLADPDYNHIPYLFESFKNWSKVMAQQRIPEPVLQATIDSTLAAIPVDGRALKYALGGIVNSLEVAHHPLFATYGNRYIESFDNKNHPALAALKKKIELSDSFVTGAIAPDFTQNNTEGVPMNLSDLRGKVVLVDFWASWCGPCRRENPNVIKVYEQYKDKGFDILGVSLDRNKDAWLKAIEKDGLPWHHVSDLKGWQNEVAQMYSVTSIPHTILLDKEGRILARNLRGPALEEALKGIFME